jgi:hypothetical protein
MSCNRVYALDDEADPNITSASQQLQVQQPQRTESLSSTQRWLEGRERHATVMLSTVVSRAELLMTLDWSRRLDEAIRSMSVRLPQVTRQRLMESSFGLFPIRGRRRGHYENNISPLNPDTFPADVQVNIFSFLHPKHVVAVACVSRACRDIVDGRGALTTALWKTLWQRDYGWLMHSWDIGREVLARSNVVSDPPFTKDFYFRFGLSYINFLIAGLNTPQRCFVGLHGSIYDITDFVISHPGSPDTLLVHAGRDATKLFDDMDHSRGARRLARNFCVAVDTSTTEYSSWGVKPTLVFPADGPTPTVVQAYPVIAKKMRRFLRTECLQQCYEAFREEETEHRKQFSLTMKSRDNVLHWNMFYDPFQRAWKVWYTSKDFTTVFVSGDEKATTTSVPDMEDRKMQR